MGCGSCGTSVDGKPSGCKSNGGCSSGGCNRLNVYDWFSDIPSFAPAEGYRFMEVSFKNGARKEIFKNTQQVVADKFDMVVVEGNMGGYDVGEVSLTGEGVRLRMRRKKMQENDARLRGVVRIAGDNDINKLNDVRKLEHQTLVRARAIAREMNIDMKVGDVEYQGDGRKATFYYTADGRVDFRELIKSYSRDFKVKIEMKQIGARQEAGRIGGIGVCGRELCCSTWLTDFKSVVTQSARYQNLSINQQKLSGQCGRLKCCLNYELDSYMEALQYIPENAERIELESGVAFLQRVDIFNKLMWYQYAKSSVFHPVHVNRVKEMLEMNKQGKKPDELGAVKVESKFPVEEKPVFVEITGSVTLDNLRKAGNNANKKKKDNRNRPQQQAGSKPQPQAGGGQQSKPQQQAKPQQPKQQQQNRPQQNKPQQPRPPQQPKPQQPKNDNTNNTSDSTPS